MNVELSVNNFFYNYPNPRKKNKSQAAISSVKYQILKLSSSSSTIP